VEVGIAEQNLVGIAAGLTMAGKKVFAVSPASFLTARALEQIKNDVAYADHSVKLIGISAGVSYGALGATHHSIHDLAAFQAVNNIDIIIPADNFETHRSIEAALNHPRPIYIRFGKKPMVNLHNPGVDFEVGKSIRLSKGKDVTYIATGETVPIAVMASELLAEEGISCGVISMHTIKPFDKDTVLEAARESKVMLSVEEHSIYGGLGSRCATLLMQQGVHLPFKVIGFPDEYLVTWNQEEIFRHYGLSPEGLAKSAKDLLIVETVS
jgi:transketolase